MARPYAAMRSHAPDAEIHAEGVGLVPLLLGFGVLYGLLPNLAHRWFGDPNRPTRAWWILSVFLIAGGFALIGWLSVESTRLGYAA